MNAGFSNLDTLKKELLAGTMQTDQRFDQLIAAIGTGIAQQFEQFTNRKFCRMVGAQEVFPADRCEFLLSRMPVEIITLAEKKCNEAKGFIAQCDDFIRIIDQANGIINTGEIDAGRHFEQIRFTFNGGFFWETLEPKDPAYPTKFPAGATCVPHDLFFAWLLQCKHQWKLMDKMGLDTIADGDVKSLRFPQDFAPTVEKTISNYCRFNLV